MKNQFFTLILSFFFLSGTAMSQVTTGCTVGPLCESIDMDFQTSGNGANIDHLENWSYSHGSPSVSTTGFWLWSHSNYGEGINYSGYNFVAGTEYTICFVAETQTATLGTPNADATFNIVGTNTPVVGNVVSGCCASIPSAPTGSQSIVNENWSTYPNPGTAVYTYSFTAISNFNNLWFYPSNTGLPQVEIKISEIVICEVDVCDASFAVCLNNQGDGTSSISATLNDSDHTLIGMYIWENGDLVYNGAPVGYIGTNGSTYTICVTVENNNTGEQCESCYTFCIGKSKLASKASESGSLINTKQLNNNKSSVPDAFKEKPQLDDTGVNISPNPSNGLFEISSTSSENKLLEVSVFDLNSRLVYSGELNEQQTRTSVDLKGQPTGVYIVKINYSDGSISQEKIILEK